MTQSKVQFLKNANGDNISVTKWKQKINKPPIFHWDLAVNNSLGSWWTFSAAQQVQIVTKQIPDELRMSFFR